MIEDKVPRLFMAILDDAEPLRWKPWGGLTCEQLQKIVDTEVMSVLSNYAEGKSGAFRLEFMKATPSELSAMPSKYLERVVGALVKISGSGGWATIQSRFEELVLNVASSRQPRYRELGMFLVLGAVPSLTRDERKIVEKRIFGYVDHYLKVATVSPMPMIPDEEAFEDGWSEWGWRMMKCVDPITLSGRW